jgi:anti-sigma B factor antagonist
MSGLGFEMRWTRLSRTASEVVVGGELDLHDVPALERVFAEAREAGATRLLVDLSAAGFLDSTVLGVLVDASRRFEDFVLAVGDYRVLRVLEITGLDRKLRVERSRCEALALLALDGAA